MSNKVALRYSLIQFMPYLETGEFANVGVIAMCPKTGYFDYKITPKYGRMTKFFPCLTGNQYKASISFFEKELIYLKNIFLNNDVDEVTARNIFDNLTHEREAIVRTTDISVRVTENEAEALEQLFDYYVGHSFINKDTNQERLTHSITKMVRAFNLSSPFMPEKIGNEEFSTNFPLVQKSNTKQPEKIINPIYFGQEDPSKIYEKSDSWLIRIDRLRRFDLLSKKVQILFAFEGPKEASLSQEKALNTVLKDIQSHKIEIVSYQDKERIQAFSE